MSIEKFLNGRCAPLIRSARFIGLSSKRTDFFFLSYNILGLKTCLFSLCCALLFSSTTDFWEGQMQYIAAINVHDSIKRREEKKKTEIYTNRKIVKKRKKRNKIFIVESPFYVIFRTIAAKPLILCLRSFFLLHKEKKVILAGPDHNGGN